MENQNQDIPLNLFLLGFYKSMTWFEGFREKRTQFLIGNNNTMQNSVETSLSCNYHMNSASIVMCISKGDEVNILRIHLYFNVLAAVFIITNV